MPRTSNPPAQRKLVGTACEQIARRLPPSWHADVELRPGVEPAIRFTAPDARTADVPMVVRKRIDPRVARDIASAGAPGIVVSEWISPRSRAILAAAGVCYVDTTGNIMVTVSEPGLFVTTTGADRDPAPPRAASVNLRGPRAWALERTLAEVLPPYSLGDLAATLGTDAGYLSRLLGGLADELLIDRPPRGPVQRVDWAAMLQQIARTYSLLDSNETSIWNAAGGPEQFLRDLSASALEGWAVTGSFASNRLVSVAAPELAVVYTEDPESLADALRLRRVRAGGNVVLAVPYDRIVFERTWTRNNLVFASLAQVAIDCLAGPSRMPAEGEALLGWMRQRAPGWQSPTFTAAAVLP